MEEAGLLFRCIKKFTVKPKTEEKEQTLETVPEEKEVIEVV